MKLTITKTGRLSKCILDSEERAIVIPEGVTIISPKAFEKCGAQIEKITLPSTLKAADGGALRLLTVLKEAVIAEGTEQIPEALFEGCAALECVSLPSTLKSIGLCAFRNCAALRQIELPEGLTEMSSFQFCSALEKISIPAGVKQVHGFKGCVSLRSVEVSEGVSVLGREAFQGCTALENVKLPDSLTYLEMLAFAGCTALQKIVIPEGVTGIGQACFADCTALERVELPDSLTMIRLGAFVNCAALREIAVPEKVDFFAAINAAYTKLGIFGGCTALEKVSMSPSQAKVLFKPTAAALKKATLPYNEKKDAQGMFEECPLVKEIILIEKQSDEWSDGTCDFITEEKGVRLIRCLKPGILEYTVPDNVAVIADDAFSQNNRLKRLHLNGLVSRINLKQFSYCRMAELTLPDNVTEVAQDDFSALASPDQYGRDVWAKLNIASTHPTYAVSDAMIIKKKDGRADALLVNMEKVRWQPLVIPQGVVRIADRACAGGKYSEVELPDSLRVIGAEAFGDNRNLAKINLPNGLEEIGEKAFAACRSLMELDIPDSVTKIGKGALLQKVVVICSKGSAAESYAIKNSMDIRYRAEAQESTVPSDEHDMSALFTWSAQKDAHILGGFIGGVDEVYLPVEKDGIRIEGYDVKIFSRVKKTLKVVHLPEGMTEIPAKMFSQCEVLKEVHLPSTLTKIGEGAFMGCLNLYRLEIPESVTEIGDKLFGSTWAAEAHIPHVILCGVTGGAVQEAAQKLGCRFVDVHADEETRRIQEQFVYYKDEKGKVIITAIYTDDEQEMVEIPEQIAGNTVSALRCDSMINVSHLKIPASLHVIETSLNYVKTLEIDPKNKYILQDGVLWYRKLGEEVGGILAGAKNQDEIVVREGTKCISQSELGFSRWIKRLVLPASIQDVGHMYSWTYSLLEGGVIAGHRGTIAEELARVCEYAMEYADDSEEVRAVRQIFPSFVREDGTRALVGYRGAESRVVIPEEIGSQKVTMIAKWCDPNDANFPQSVHLPSTMKELEAVYLAQAQVEVAAENPVFFSEDGKLYGREKGRLVFCPPSADMQRFYSGMKEIGGQAIVKLHVDELMIPEGVERVEFGKSSHVDVSIGRMILSKSVTELEVSPFSGLKASELVLHLNQVYLAHRAGLFNRVVVVGEDGEVCCVLNTAALDISPMKYAVALANVVVGHDAVFENVKDTDEKISMALHRLAKPYLLEEEVRGKMKTYLRRQVKRAASAAVGNQDVAALRVLLDLGMITKKNVQPILDLCGEQGRIEMMAILLEYTQNER